MKKLVVIVLLLGVVTAGAQRAETEVLQRMKRFHELMTGDRAGIENYIDDSLSYGHSNGWIESRSEFYSNLGKKIDYHSFREDSIRLTVNKGMAHVRFVADIELTMDGKQVAFHLRVLEVWVKRKNNWKLFARQAIR